MAEEHDVTKQDEDTLKGIDEYWTEERLREAKPVVPPEPSTEEMERIREQEESAEARGLELIAPAGEADPILGGSPYAPDIEQRPYWNCGAIFFTTPEGDMYGSASFVGNNREIMTAAHCVRSGKTGDWYKNVVFYRAYWFWGLFWGGQKVGISCLGTKAAWPNGNQGNFAYDYSFCYTSDTSGAGWLGLVLGVPYTTWTSVGYPGNYGSGNKMYAVAGDKGQTPDNLVQMLGNPFTQGCSGGPWIANLSSTYSPYNNLATGLNSFFYSSDPGKLWGPLFDGGTSELYNYMSTNPC